MTTYSVEFLKAIDDLYSQLGDADKAYLDELYKAFRTVHTSRVKKGHLHDLKLIKSGHKSIPYVDLSRQIKYFFFTILDTVSKVVTVKEGIHQMLEKHPELMVALDRSPNESYEDFCNALVQSEKGKINVRAEERYY